MKKQIIKNKKYKCFVCQEKFSISEEELKTHDKKSLHFLYCDKCMETFDTDRHGMTIETHDFEIVKYKSEDFDKCNEIYQRNFFNDVLGEKDKDAFDTSREENQLFVMKIKGEIVGLGGYQKVFDNKMAVMLRSEFEIKYSYNDGYKKKLDDYVLELIKSDKNIESISLHLSRESDVEYYKEMGFVLYKDFKTQDPEFYEDIWGKDYMRFALDMFL
jgi:hypothetical protein